jgi:hypothetical protein
MHAIHQQSLRLQSGKSIRAGPRISLSMPFHWVHAGGPAHSKGGRADMPALLLRRGLGLYLSDADVSFR